MEINKHMELLGMKVIDRVTGFKGVVSSVSFDLYGCIQAIVTPEAGDLGKQESGMWFDVSRLRVTGKKPVMEVPNYEYGRVAKGKKGCAEKPAGRV